MAIVWFSEYDRARLRREQAEAAKTRAEYDRICSKYARLASRDPSQIDFDKIGRLDIRPWPDRPNDA